MSQNLESMTDEDPATVAARSRHVLTGPQSQIDAAVDRVDSFLAEAKSKYTPPTAPPPPLPTPSRRRTS